MIGGAGTQHAAAGGFEAAAFSRRDRLRGRCMIQTWSRSSTATPATWPSVQLFGSGFGQNGSTSNFGTSAAAAIATQALINTPATIPRRTTLAILRIFFLPSLPRFL